MGAVPSYFQKFKQKWMFVLRRFTNELLRMIITFVNCHTISSYVWPVHFIWWHAQNVRCEDGDHSEIISYYSTYNLHVLFPEQRSKCGNLVIFLNTKYQVNPYAILLWKTYRYLSFTNPILLNFWPKTLCVNEFLQSSNSNPTSVPAALLLLTSTVENRSVQCSRG